MGPHAIRHIRDRAGELRHIQKLRFWPLDAVLHDKYLLPKEEADMIASFLNPMLRLNPDKRAKASELIHHAWLDGIVVQGEIDIIRRAEDEEQRKKRLAQEATAAQTQPQTQSQGGKENVPIAVEAADADAMKPVDENGGTGEPPGPRPATNPTLKENAPALTNSHPPVTLHAPKPPASKRSS